MHPNANVIPSIEAKEVADEAAPNAQAWRKQLAQLERENKRLKAELQRLKKPKKNASKPAPTQKKHVGAWHSGTFTAYYPPTQASEAAMQGSGTTAKGDSLHASLTYKGNRIIAAPPSVPFNTVVEIEVGGQYIKAIVRDRGGAIKGDKFDIAMADKQSAVQFGKQTGRWRVVE